MSISIARADSPGVRQRSSAGISPGEPHDPFADFPVKPSAGDFQRLLEVMNDVEGHSPGIALQFIWPIWQRHDHLPLINNCVKSCARSLDWSSSPDAFAIARRFVECLELFPELALLADPAELAQGILKRATGGATLHYCALAYFIEPRAGIAERLLLELTRAGELQAVLRLLPTIRQGNDAFLSKLLAAIPRDADESTVIDLCAQIADRLPDGATLAHLRFGDKVGPILQTDPAHAFDPMRIADAVTAVRQLLRKRQSSVVERGMPVSVPYKEMESLVASYLHHLVAGNSNNASHAKHLSEGRISWVQWQIERGILARIPASKFLSSYAKIEGTSLYATRHVAGEPFQFGPYVDLPAGCYRVAFVGRATTEIYELAVVSQQNTRKIQSAIFTTRSDKTSADILGAVDFCLLTAEKGVEFLIQPMARTGELASSGVELQCMELF